MPPRSTDNPSRMPLNQHESEVISHRTRQNPRLQGRSDISLKLLWCNTRQISRKVRKQKIAHLMPSLEFLERDEGIQWLYVKQQCYSRRQPFCVSLSALACKMRQKRLQFIDIQLAKNKGVCCVRSYRLIFCFAQGAHQHFKAFRPKTTPGFLLLWLSQHREL